MADTPKPQPETQSEAQSEAESGTQSGTQSETPSDAASAPAQAAGSATTAAPAPGGRHAPKPGAPSDAAPKAVPAPVRRPGKTRILITFSGSDDLECGWTTVGDLMALYNVAKRVVAEYDDVDILWPLGGLAELTPHCINPKQAERRAHTYTTMIFCCGPLGTGLMPLFEKFWHTKRIAVGVSLLESTPPESLVHAWYARDSKDGVGFDLALADIGYPHFVAPLAARRQGRAALCMVGLQGEYGGRCGNQLVDKYVREVMEGKRRKPVNTLLDLNRAIPESTELDLQGSEYMITTRLHGSLLSIFHKVPLVVFDQIRDGAKVTRVLERVDQPVLQAWTTTREELAAAIEALPETHSAERMEARKQTLVSLARASLDEAIQVIRDEVI